MALESLEEPINAAGEQGKIMAPVSFEEPGDVTSEREISHDSHSI